MHIAQIAPLKSYGGTERLIRWLAEELVALGHDVTLCTSDRSTASSIPDALLPRVLYVGDSIGDTDAHHISIADRVRQCFHCFDFFHFHSNDFPRVFLRQDIPFVTTLYERLGPARGWLASDALSPRPTVSLSDSQRRPVLQVNWIRTIYPGLPQRLLTPLPAEPRYFAFLGSIAPGKRVDRAISIARQCGVPIRIAAGIGRENCEYFDAKIRLLLDGSSAEYIGEITDAEKSEFLSGAVALLDPAESPEPFDLAMIEAMACGTPIIAFDRGSAPEIVENGRTGFIVEDETGAVEAFDQLSRLSRGKIRNRFEQRFTARHMALEYLDVYRSLLEYDIHGLNPFVDLPGATNCEPGAGPGRLSEL
jgi:glycosyltransferase involved in cell wall biosynthesis